MRINEIETDALKAIADRKIKSQKVGLEMAKLQKKQEATREAQKKVQKAQREG